MKKKALMMAAVAGLLAVSGAITPHAVYAEGMSADANSCKGAGGCGGKNDCSGKASCAGMTGDEASTEATAVAGDVVKKAEEETKAAY